MNDRLQELHELRDELLKVLAGSEITEELRQKLLTEISDVVPDIEKVAELSEKLVQLDPSAMRFSVDARHIHRLGYELVGKQETALSELIKNAYDADASRVEITFTNYEQPGGDLVVSDDGHGMTEKVIRETWMRLSTSDKEENPQSPVYCRSRAGRKGIGRFAVERLGTRLILESRVAGASEGISIHFDWDSAFQHGAALTRIPNRIERFPKQKDECGTRLLIQDLRDRWTESQFKRVWKSVLLLQPPFQVARNHRRGGLVNSCQPDPGFEVVINDNTKGQQAEKLSLETNFLSNRAALIRGEIDSDGNATFFLDSKKLDIKDSQQDDLKYFLIGELAFEASYFIYASDFISGVGVRQSQKIGEEYGGIRIYRDGFRVLPYGESHDDWLRLAYDTSRRSLLVPANNQNFFGHIDLSSMDNSLFEETSSREGLIENEAYAELQVFVRRALEWGAKRVASARGRKQTASQQNFVSARRKPSEATQELIEDLRDGDQGQGVVDDETVERLEKNKQEQERYEAEVEARDSERARYEEMLRILASLGTSVAVFGHEVQGATTRVQGALRNIEILLRGGGSGPEDVDQVLADSHAAVEGLTELGGYITDLVDQSKARHKQAVALYGAIERFVEHFKKHLDARNVVFEKYVTPLHLRTLPMHRSEIDSVLFNFLTNALKSMERSNSKLRKIRITGESRDGFAVVGFEDTGEGIAESIRDKVFDAFFTTSHYSGDNVAGPGSGLGLKIVSDIAEANGGFVRVADPHEGYACKLEFAVPLAEGQRE